jgi:hypothetical protein
MCPSRLARPNIVFTLDDCFAIDRSREHFALPMIDPGASPHRPSS